MSAINLLPPLKWAGGKRWLVPKLQNFWLKSQSRLVEPFVGGMSVALGLNPSHALLNDFNAHLINFYCCLKTGLVNTIPMANEREFFYEYRSTFNRSTGALAFPDDYQALLFYYLNRTGFNGLCRFNERGQFNVPFGKYKTIVYAKDFVNYQVLLQPWDFSCGDFDQIFLLDNDFIYADPPYDAAFSKYNQRDFTWDDQQRLALWLRDHSGQVVASNHATDRVIALYKSLDFRVEIVEAPRRISANGDRVPALEMLAYRGF